MMQGRGSRSSLKGRDFRRVSALALIIRLPMEEPATKCGISHKTPETISANITGQKSRARVYRIFPPLILDNRLCDIASRAHCPCLRYPEICPRLPDGEHDRFPPPSVSPTTRYWR